MLPVKKTLLALVLLCCSGFVFGAVSDLSVTKYRLIEKTRINRSDYQYTYAITLRNTAGALENVTATVSSASSKTTITDAVVDFGTIVGGNNPSVDTFSFIQDRRLKFSASNLRWTFTGDEPAGENTAPVANAGADQSVPVGSVVNLDGSASSDIDSDPLTYSWNLIPPAGSGAALNDGAATAPFFTADIAGVYTATLVVNDGTVNSVADSVTITVTRVNTPPVANAGVDQTIFAGTLAELDGSASSDADGDALSYSWALSRPAGSAAVLSDSTIANPTFIADIAGLYSATLSVSDGTVSSDVDTVVIRASDPDLNAPPVLAPIADVTTAPNVLLTVTAVGSDPDSGDTLMYLLASAPLGMAIDASSGEITWTPDDTQLGAVTVVVQVSDTAGLSDARSFMVTVVADNAPPIARDDNYQGTIGELLSEPAPGVMTNDTDPNGDATTATLVDAPARGTAVLQPDGSFTYLYEPVPPVPAVIELETHCSTVDLHPLLPGNGPIGQVAVGDVDHDGETEIVGLNFSRFFILDAATCALEYQHAPNFSSATEPRDSNLWGSLFDSRDHLGIADLDGDGDLEIVGLSSGLPGTTGTPDNDIFGHLVALHHDGSFVWNRPVAPGKDPRLANLTPVFRNPAHPTASIGDWRDTGPTFADLDGDGRPEIIMGFYHDDQTTGSSSAVIPGVVAFNGIDGSIKWVFYGTRTSVTGPSSMMAQVADLDLDGTPEIVYGNNVIDHNGNLEFSLQLDDLGSGGVPRRVESAIANFDDDAFGEILVRHEKSFYVFEHDGTRKWKKVFSTAPGVSTAAGEITVGDFDGDGKMEFTHRLRDGTTAPYQVVYDTDGTQLWSHLLHPDYHSNLYEGPQAVTAYDVNGDGADDIVADLRVDALTDDPALGLGDAVLFAFNGRNGAELFRARSYQDSSSSVFPVIADLDNDGEAEILLSGQRPLNARGAGNTPFHIYQGKSSSPLPPAPRVSNQWSFNAAYVNVDGSIPVKPIPHWLVPQMNGFHKVPIVADVQKPRAVLDSFTYKITDGSLDSNTAMVNLAVSPPMSPPVILSTAIRFATQDTPYVYGVIAADPDVGDTLSYFLTVAPTGMTIDPATHLINWTPGAADLGDHAVTVIVQDSDGLAAIQDFTVTVAVPAVVPNVIGQTTANALVQIQAVNLLPGTIDQVFDAIAPAGNVIAQAPVAGTVVANGSKVNLVASKGPGPLDTDDDGDGVSENQGDCNDADSTIFPGAVDAQGDGIDQNCDGVDGLFGNAQIFIAPNMPLLLVGQSINLTATAVMANQSSVNITQLGIWSSDNAAVVQSNGNGAFVTTGAGSTTVRVTHLGFSAAVPITVAAPTPGDTTPPTAAITSPAANATITAPTEITGTATDANFFKYVLDMAPAGETDYTVIRESGVPVSGGVLGQFDPTLLLNDLYSVRLRVYDTGGNVSTVESVYQVDGDMKVGNFSLTFTDLEIPMSGIPITVNRTYDSRDKRKGDFGVGWRLDVQTLSIRANRELGTGWQVVKQGLNFQLVATDEHKVSLTLPGGRVEVFNMVVSPLVSPLVPFPPFANRVVFQPRPGTTGSLQSLDNNNLTILDPQPGVISLLDDTNNNAYNPDRFRYTAQDGTVIVISKANGVQSIREPNGNTLTFNALGIFHSAGKRALFERDSEGRIVKLIDPNGHEQLYGYDSNGDLISHSDQEANTTAFAYNQNHGLLRITDPLGRTVARNEYDDQGRLISSTNADGRRVEFSHDLTSRQEIVTDADGSFTVLEYDEMGNAIRVTNPLGGVTTNTYDSRGNRLTTTNPLGETITRTFDARNNTLTETDPLGNTIRYAYDALDILISTTDPRGNVTTYSYDSKRNKLSETDASGRSRGWTYDARGNVTSITDKRGATVAYEYDAFGNNTATTDARGNRRTVSFDNNGNAISFVNRRGFSSQTIRDNRGQVLETIDPLNFSTTYVYTGSGVLATITDATGNYTAFVTDAEEKELERVDALGNSIRREYDIKSNLTSIIDALGNATSLEYDQLNRMTRSVDAAGGIAEKAFDSAGRVVSQTDKNGNVTSIEYDAAGRRTRILDPLGNQVLFEYDAAGNVTRQTDAKGNVYSSVYDALNRRISIQYPDGAIETSVYDDRNLVSQTDAAGRQTQYEYDENGNLSKVTDALGHETTYVYDAENNLIQRTDANGNSTVFSYDANNREISKMYPDGSTHQLVYDSRGNVITQVNANAAIIDFEYDALNQLLSKQLGSGGSVSYSYEPTGRLQSSTDERGQTLFSYDVLDRLTRVVNPDASEISYSYDAVGNVISTAYKTSGSTPPTLISKTYDALNRLSSVTDGNGNTTSYQYDRNGNRSQVTYPNGTMAQYTYDSRNRLIQISHFKGATLLEQFTYTLNIVGDRVRVEKLDSSYITYQYDSIHRLVREVHHDGVGTVIRDLSYVYDSVGNRLSKTDNVGSVTNTYQYDAADRMTNDGTFVFVYDANGNLVEKSAGSTVISYAYDTENRLVESRSPGSVIEYRYDAFGNRVEKSDALGTIYFLVDSNNNTGYQQVIAEYSSSGSSVVQYLYGDDLIQQERVGSIAYYHYDGTNSTRFLTDASGNLTDSYQYEGFGVLAASTGITPNSYLFTGEQFDANLGFYYLRARYYAPEDGRFITKDPFQGNNIDPQSLHKYLYANANPLNVIDPSGLWGENLTSLQVSQVIGATISISFTGFGIAAQAALDPKYLASYSTGRAVYQLASSGVLGALAGTLAKGLGYTLVRGGGLGEFIYYEIPYASISSYLFGVAATLSCAGEGAIFEIASLSSEKCVREGAIAAGLFVASGALGNFFTKLGTLREEVTIGAISEAFQRTMNILRQEFTYKSYSSFVERMVPESDRDEHFKPAADGLFLK